MIRGAGDDRPSPNGGIWLFGTKTHISQNIEATLQFIRRNSLLEVFSSLCLFEAYFYARLEFGVDWALLLAPGGMTFTARTEPAAPISLHYNS